MAEKSAGKTAAKVPGSRDARLKAALKANMARRKAQARGRAAEADEDQAGHQTPDNESANDGE